MKIIFIFLFFCPSLFASEIWDIAGIEVEYEVVTNKMFLINKSCAQNLNICEAGKKSQAQRPKLGELKGGINPGSIVCEFHGGHVVIGHDDKKNTQAFCLFNDKSSASLDAF